MVKAKEDLTGKRFGRLLVISQDEDIVEKNGRHRATWLCKCDCSNYRSVVASSLKRGYTKSCGCLSKESVSKAKKKYNNYDLTGEYGIGYTSKGEEFYFDLEDYDKIKNYCWRTNAHGYLTTRDQDTQILMHRIVMNCPVDKQVDHKEHNKLDNRKSNLRIVTNQQNSMNKMVRTDNKSGATGVWWDKECDKWRAYIMTNHKQVHLGYFESFNDAVKTRKEAETKYFGEFRFINDMN